jgi:hypothetical protein
MKATVIAEVAVAVSDILKGGQRLSVQVFHRGRKRAEGIHLWGRVRRNIRTVRLGFLVEKVVLGQDFLSLRLSIVSSISHASVTVICQIRGQKVSGSNPLPFQMHAEIMHQTGHYCRLS